MPAWWPIKSSKSREETQQNPHGKFANFINLSANKTDVNNNSSNSNKSKGCKGDKPRSFDEGSRNSPRGSKDFGLATGGSSGFSGYKPRSFDEGSRNSPRGSKDFGLVTGGSSGFLGFDSDSVERRGHPLPQPSVSSIQSDLGAVIASGSGSVTSVSSSESSEDHLVGNDHAAQLAGYRGQGEIKFNMGSRSPGPTPRGPTSPTSPLHPLLCGTSLESPTSRLEDGRSQGHPLPLPPGSPTSPSALATTRSGGVTENAPCSLSKWKKGRLLGRGAFGHVYLGFNSENGQMCAIKEVRVVSDDRSSKECLKQLNQEINLLNQLSHPNIVRYYGSELGDEALSVYLEYVSGGSIQKLLQEYGSFREPVIQNYTRQIVSGLAYLHGRNTVHRDIKGANILVDPNGEIKLADFGMAKHSTSCFSMLSFKGSPYWMAPEVVMNTNGYSLAVDIWSLGCTILEMATSKPPWSQYEGVAAIFKIGNSKDMPDIPDYLSNDAKNFVKLCLQRDPSARPTAVQLLDHSFIRDQATTGVANMNITREAFPHKFDGSRTPPILELHSHRPSITSDGEYASRPVVSTRVLNNPRDNVRMITSLPVSPCSSPLRQYGPAHKSCLLSPPHPTFPAVGGQSRYNVNDYSAYPMRPNSRYTHDPWFDNSILKAQTPGGSPKARHIL